METKLLQDLLIALQTEMGYRLASENSLYPDEYGGYERKDYHDGQIAGMEEIIDTVNRFLQSRIDAFGSDQELLNNKEAMDKARNRIMQITGYPSHVVDDMDYTDWTAMLSSAGFFWDAATKEWAHNSH